MKKMILAVLLIMLIVPAFIFAGGKQEEPAVGAAPAAAEPVVFKFNNGAEPESLDPAVIEGVPEHYVYTSLFEGLVSYNPETLGAEPGVAESWEVSADSLTWTFHLRKNAVWSDGKSITAPQFVASWLRFLDPETAARICIPSRYDY